MNDARYEELDRKRFAEGLSEEEANELGQMLAEKMGKPYGNARDREHPETLHGDERSVDKKLDRRNLPPEDMPDEEVREQAEEQVGDQWDDREESPLPKKIA